MSLAVKRYADALLDVCFEENCQDNVYTEFKLFYEQMRTDKEFERLVTESVLSSEEKKALFEKVLPNGSAYFMNFLKTLADRGRENELMDMFPEFERGYKERKNILEAEAVTAVEMTPEQVEKITEELAEKYGKTIVLKTSVDPTILGGMVLYVGNEMLDASVKARFEGLKKQLKTIQLQ